MLHSLIRLDKLKFNVLFKLNVKKNQLIFEYNNVWSVSFTSFFIGLFDNEMITKNPLVC